MKAELVESLLCPRCYSQIELRIEEEKYGGVYRGEITCNECNNKYPIIEGVSLLSVIDRTWKPMLQEIVTRLDIHQKVVLDGGFEKDRAVADKKSRDETSQIMDKLFSDAVLNLEVDKETRVLDVGAGLCETSQYFADLGADVVAADTELSHLRTVDFGQANLRSSEFLEFDRTYGFESYTSIARRDIQHQYFSRVMADIRRLPFREGSFDITLCRSTMHHVNNMPKAIKEMARVTRAGGKILLISEPIRSVLDKETDYLGDCIDYQEGLNERTTPILHYTLPLKRHCDQLEIKYYRPGCWKRTQKLFDLMGVHREAHFFHCEKLDFWHSFKLLFAGASLNIMGTRSQKTARRPRPVDDKKVIANVRDLAVELDSLWEHKERVRSIYRSLLEPKTLPYSVDVYKADKQVLRKGWRVPQSNWDPKTRSHFTLRYTHKRAICYMRNKTSKKNIVIRIHGYPKDAGEATGTIFVNGREGCRYRLLKELQDLSFNKPVNHEKIIEIEICNDSTFVPDRVLGNGDTRELGVGVQKIWQE